jgi:hypothetical protein
LLVSYAIPNLAPQLELRDEYIPINHASQGKTIRDRDNFQIPLDIEITLTIMPVFLLRGR